MQGADGEPIVAVKTYGRGRVVALGYLNAGLSADIDWKILGQRDNHWWEYFYSMVCRSIIWSAHREPSLTLGPLAAGAPDAAPGSEAGKLTLQVSNSSRLANAEFAVTVVNEWGETVNHFTRSVTLTPGTNSFSLPLPLDSYDGRHFVDVIVSAARSHYAWGSASYDIARAGNEIGWRPEVPLREGLAHPLLSSAVVIIPAVVHEGDPFIDGAVVPFTAACWMVGARAST